MKVTYDTPFKLVITLKDLTSRNNKSFSDITDAIFFIKNNQSDTDEDAVVSKSVGDGLIISSDTIEVNILDTDYGTGKLASGEDYLICLGVEFNSSGFYIEDYDPRLDYSIEILRDKIRQG